MNIAERAERRFEVRDFAVDSVELRDTESNGLSFEGTASVVDTPYTVTDMFGEFTETIQRGSFNRTLKQRDDVALLVNHLGVPLARTKSGTLTLSADPNLRSFAQLDGSNPTVQEIASAMRRGDLDQMSIGMRVHDDEWNDDYTERVIKEVELRDVSVVTFPASTTTTASLRSAVDELLACADDLDGDTLLRAIEHLQQRMSALTPPSDADAGLVAMHPDLAELHYSALRMQARALAA